MFQILVVEDDKDLNRTVCIFLNRSGYQAIGCLTASDAYDAMYETIFDLIVPDIMMPGIDGFEFAQTVRSLNENIPIGLAGLTMVALAYPIYNRTLKRERERIAPEILKITDEILK